MLPSPCLNSRLAIVLLGSILLGDEPLADTSGDVAQVLSLIDGMESAWSDVRDYVMVVEKTERLVDGATTHQRVLIKFLRPGSYYMKILDGPRQGSELIYPKSSDEAVAVAHAGGFTGGFSRFLKKTRVLGGVVPSEFSLQDPAIISGQHQTVVDAGLGNTIRRIARNLRTAAESGEGKMQLGRVCPDTDECRFRIDVELPAFAGQFHEVRDGESLWSIADQYDRPMYVIWYNNPSMKKPVDLEAGQQVFVPKYYAAKGRIWISAATMLLSELEIFDKDGNLYEHYIYESVRTNVGLTDSDFDTSNSEYRF